MNYIFKHSYSDTFCAFSFNWWKSLFLWIVYDKLLWHFTIDRTELCIHLFSICPQNVWYYYTLNILFWQMCDVGIDRYLYFDIWQSLGSEVQRFKQIKSLALLWLSSIGYIYIYCSIQRSKVHLKVLLQWNSTSVYTSCTYSTYHLELALGTFICHFISACLVFHTS